MSFKDILVHLDRPEAAGPALAAGLALARDQGGHLTGLYAYDLAAPRPGAAGGYLDAATLQRLLREAEAAAMHRATMLRALFEAALRREALPGEWRQVDGDVAATLALHARYADLSIFARPARDNQESMLAEAVLFAAGRPVLLVPPAPVPPRAFAAGEVLIGWNGRREAARAVADAMPLLRRAARVRVLTIATAAGQERERRIDAEDLARHLARHGLAVTAETRSAGSRPVAELLLEAAARAGSDLLVIGGYGHGRLRELVLGGVTRRLMRHAPIPVLLSH